MTYPFVQAKYFTPGGIREVRGLLWHMAEGFGTVSWLTHPSNDNSSHFVIEKSGRIVQMVRFTDASHSAHVAFDPNEADAENCGIYAATVGRAVLGSGWADINRYVISTEVEGFRSVGPNAAQSDAIVRLYRDLRARFPQAVGNLGHRDVQDYKSCPGCHFPWSRIDGHGLFAPAIPDTSTEAPTMPSLVNAGAPFLADVAAAKQLYRQDGTELTKASKDQVGKYALPVKVGTADYVAIWPVTTGGVAQVVLVKPADVDNERPIDASAARLTKAKALAKQIEAL